MYSIWNKPMAAVYQNCPSRIRETAGAIPTARAVVNGKEILLNDYVRVFYSHCALRPACHECPFVATERKTDMTIGDFWHIEEKMPEFLMKAVILCY